MRRVLVLGTGMIGTSVALALRQVGIHVGLFDRDAHSVAEAVRMGAGAASRAADPPADLVIIATPPSTVAEVLRAAQDRGLGAVYTDVASTKARLVSDAELAGCDLSSFVPGHPLAGTELSGPRAARADLFAGRPWVLCPLPATRLEPVRVVTELITACGAEIRLLSPRTHDRFVAAVSHAPHVVSAALAARFADPDDHMLALVGRGLQDTTRIATSPPGLWCDILAHNAGAVAAELEAVARDLTAAAAALRGADRADGGALADLLARGNRGREHIVAAEPARWATHHFVASNSPVGTA
jgi:prephenate dehydrogenase